jgi:AcrR family transcriptional regulator
MTEFTDRDVSPETLREAILDAATACFTEFGYDGTSIEAIAARCGHSVDAVTEHFAGVAEIRTALLGQWSERLSAWITSA